MARPRVDALQVPDRLVRLGEVVGQKAAAIRPLEEAGVPPRGLQERTNVEQINNEESRPTMTRLTTDHSMVTELARAGVISPEQMHSSPSRHIILRALGGRKQDNPDPDVTTCVVQAGDRLVLCCDGLWSMLAEEQIATVVSRNTSQAACDELIRLANEAGGEDNISVVVLSFT